MAQLHYSCVLFDLDGTLVDTLKDIAAAMNHALRSHGFAPLSVEDYRPLVGNGIRRLAYDAMPVDAKNESLAAIVAGSAAAYYAEHPADFSRPYPGITETLLELKRLKVKTAVLSNKPDAVTQLVVSRLFTAESFDAVAGEKAGVARKPDPEASWEALAALDRTPRQTMLLGDSEVDMSTAKNIGCLPVGVSWGFRTIAELERSGAAIIIDKPEEISALVLGRHPRLSI